jgi:DNA-binding Lrp family transcriptional regulator
MRRLNVFPCVPRLNQTNVQWLRACEGLARSTLQLSAFWFSKILKSYVTCLTVLMTNIESNDIHGRLEASVNIFVEPSQKAQVIDALEKVENIEEIYDVKGEFDIVSIVSASSVEEFRNVLHKRIMKIKGVKSTLVSVVLKSHKSLSNIQIAKPSPKPSKNVPP